MKHVVKISVMAAVMVLLLGAAFAPTASAWYPPQPAYCTYVPTYNNWGYGSYPTVNYVYVCYPNQSAVPYNNYAYVPYNYGYAPYNNYAYAPYNYSYVPYNSYAYAPHNNMQPYFDRRNRDYSAGRSYPNSFSNHWNYAAGWKK